MVQQEPRDGVGHGDVVGSQPEGLVKFPGRPFAVAGPVEGLREAQGAWAS